jgi:hypothetical protein
MSSEGIPEGWELVRIDEAKLIKTAPGNVEKTARTANWTGEKKRCGVCQITKAIKHFEAKRQVCNECRWK